MDYGCLAPATGGILKGKEVFRLFSGLQVCLWPVQKMKSLHELPSSRVYVMDDSCTKPSHISIPQHKGLDVPIETHNDMPALKMPGVHFSLAGNFSTRIEHMVQKRMDWVDCLHTKPVFRGNAWLSFYLQLFPGILWGLVTVCMSPIKLDKSFQWVYEKTLPFLVVSCKIKKEWRTLPEMYQGIVLPNILLVALLAKVSFLLLWPGTQQCFGNSIRQLPC
jgi:hypothetical protein